jgi:elongation factor 1 alpha-like protein
MSSNDKEAMRQATVDVKAAIKDDFSATDEEIQESLWYYYFDVDKTVTYLQSM